jgi:hypothetical protein
MFLQFGSTVIAAHQCHRPVFSIFTTNRHVLIL